MFVSCSAIVYDACLHQIFQYKEFDWGFEPLHGFQLGFIFQGRTGWGFVEKNKDWDFIVQMKHGADLSSQVPVKC